MPMTPWAFTDDLTVPLNAARFLLGENDANTAILTDAAIESGLSTFGWQQGMAVLAQNLIVHIGQDVIRSAEQGGATYEWARDRLDGLKAVKTQADRGILPDPDLGQVTRAQPGTVTVTNAPQW